MKREVFVGDRLFVAVMGSRNSGKSTTWNELFGRTVKTGVRPHRLDIGKGRRVDVFLISGSPEERKEYAGDVLKDVECRIIRCSVQYTEAAVSGTWSYVFDSGFSIYAQWLNPGFNELEQWDQLGLVNILLGKGATVSIRDGRRGHALLTHRVEEIRQFIDGWATARDLVYQQAN